MDDLAYIQGLMREEHDKVGFLPLPAVRDRYLKTGHVLWIPGRDACRHGYILHATPGLRRYLSINQCVVEHDHRRKHNAAEAIQKLIDQARAAGVWFLRCHTALDLDATELWTFLGFQLVGLDPGSAHTRRVIGEFRLFLAPPQLCQDAYPTAHFGQVQSIDLGDKHALDAMWRDRFFAPNAPHPPTAGEKPRRDPPAVPPAVARWARLSLAAPRTCTAGPAMPAGGRARRIASARA